MSSIFASSKVLHLARAALISSNLLKLNNHVLNPFTTSFLTNSQTQQVRNSTKKAAGSKTHMKDSAGRRLGPKKLEGALVGTGQILYRQRGTKIHPGENTGIGKDHTIFALEPGYVRYYFDPFHPGRKFVGVALTEDLRLPSDHWSPRPRRFGFVEIKNANDAAKEEQHLQRKDWLLKQKLDKEIAERQAKNEVKKQSFGETLAGWELNDNIDLATDRLLLIEKYLRNGFKIDEAEKHATITQLYNYKLSLKRNEIDEIKYEELKKDYLNLSEKLDASVDFNSDYQLVKKISFEEKINLKNSLITELKSLNEKLPYTKESKSKIFENIENSKRIGVINKSEFIQLKRKFYKPVLPETFETLEKPEKGSVTYKRFDYQLNKVVTVIRSKKAFASNIK